MNATMCPAYVVKSTTFVLFVCIFWDQCVVPVPTCTRKTWFPSIGMRVVTCVYSICIRIDSQLNRLQCDREPSAVLNRVVVTLLDNIKILSASLFPIRLDVCMTQRRGEFLSNLLCVWSAELWFCYSLAAVSQSVSQSLVTQLTHSAWLQMVMHSQWPEDVDCMRLRAATWSCNVRADNWFRLTQYNLYVR